MQTVIHYFLHLGVPLIFTYLFFKNKWKRVYLIFILSMLIDLDHLLASPIFDPNRCSINFHPLHSKLAILIYVILIIPKKTRIVGIALLFHILTDYIDCYMSSMN